MMKFINFMTVAAILVGVTSLLLLVGSQFTDAELWFCVIAIMSLAIIGAMGVVEWIYNKGTRDEYDRTKRLDDTEEETIT